MKLLYLEWEDAASIGNSWITEEEALKNTIRRIKQVGWLLKEDKKQITLVATLDLDKKNQRYVSDGITILVKSIIKK